MLLLISSCSKWQLCHQRISHKIPFGPLFWCQIIVEGDKVEREVSQKEKAEGSFICLQVCCEDYPLHAYLNLVVLSLVYLSKSSAQPQQLAFVL